MFVVVVVCRNIKEVGNIDLMLTLTNMTLLSTIGIEYGQRLIYITFWLN